MRSIMKCRTTVLAAVAALPALAAASVTAPEPAARGEVLAWVVGDPGFASPRFRTAIAIDGLAPGDIAARFAALPTGSRVAYSERLLAGFVGDAGDRVVVAGRITDHAGPWLESASRRTQLEFELLAKELVSRGASIDALILGGGNPLAAEKLDTADDLVWMAIRNDARFEATASEALSLAGEMTPTNPQWKAWNEFADVTIAKAIEESVATPLRAANGSLTIAAPIVEGLGRRELEATPVAIRMYGTFSDTAGGSTTAFEVLADDLEIAVKASRGSRLLQPWLRPYSHAGTRGARSAVAGTLLWDELVRHAAVLGGGCVVYLEDRSPDLAAPDAARFSAVLDGVADELAGESRSYAGEVSIRRGQGFIAVGVPTASGEVLWRISFGPGIGGVDVEIDGGGLRVERRRGESGAWLRTAADSRIEFFDRAFARRDATTGGGLVGAPTTKVSGKVGPLLSGGPEGIALGDSGVGDLNGDGVVDGVDLAIHLASGPGSPWGGGVADLNGDGLIDGADMAIHLSGGPDANWNGAGWNDLNGDGVNNGADLAIDLAGDRSTGPWNGTGWSDLNGDGVNDGADLAITLAGGGANGAALPGDLNGDGRVDGADLAIELAGRIRTRKPAPDVAGRPTIVDGGVSTVDDPADGGDSGDPPGGTSNTGGTPPTVDPTTPVTPPAGDTGAPDSPRPNLPIPTLLSDSLLETTGTSLYVSPGITEEILASGGVPARVVYQMIDPTAAQGLASAEHIAAWVESEWGSNPSGWFILDYEVPHFSNLSKGLQNPQDPSFIQTRDSLISALRELKQRFPDARWSIYGMPSMPSWFAVNGSNHTHVSIPVDLLSPILEQRRNVYQSIIDECDFLCPTIYDRHDERNSPTPAAAAQSLQNTRLRNERVVALSKQMVANSQRPDRPVLPFVNLWYAPGGIGEDFHLIPRDQVRAKQIEPAIAAGADSIVVWTAAGYYARLATIGDQPSNQEQQQVRAAFASDILSGNAPASWQSLQVRQQIVDFYSTEVRALLDTISEVRVAAAGAPE